MAEVYTDLNEKNKIARVDISDKRVIPVILLPGIMGSNLKEKDSEESLWLVDDAFSLLQWSLPTHGAIKRKNKLHPARVSVDNIGKVIPIPSEEELSQLKKDYNRDKSAHNYATQALYNRYPGFDDEGKYALTPSKDEKSRLKKDIQNIEHKHKRAVQALYEKYAEFVLFGYREARGWGEVSFLSYGSFLDDLQRKLLAKKPPLNIADEIPGTEGNTNEPLLTKEKLKVLKKYLFPVHAIGYVWLDSSMNSAKKVGGKIEKIISDYRRKGMKCNKVILVTHSMGGLVARYYSECLGGAKNIYGIIHGVMPSIGAAATYTRMKRGTENSATGYNFERFKGFVTAEILGKNAAEMTAICSQSPGPLELLPSKDYGMRWLRIQHDYVVEKEPITLPPPELDVEYEKETDPEIEADIETEEETGIEDEPGVKTKDLEPIIISGTARYPKADPYEEIYLRRDKWWKLIDEELLNPKTGRTEKDWGIYEEIILEKVKPFHERISGKFHSNTYTFYGETNPKNILKKFKTQTVATWSETGAEFPWAMTFEGMISRKIRQEIEDRLSKPLTDRRVKTGEVNEIRTIRTTDGELKRYKLNDASNNGDGTVPVHSGKIALKNVKERLSIETEHEPAYGSPISQLFTLRSIIKIAQQVYNDKDMAF
ncbi:hypothetical protein GWD52_11275 [Enterobacteriaceae bacterium 4M9]|nr:hypothetical protein [Enterobacteriaceae bacterium 4M9]